jgi:hypothetical protein
MSQGAMRGGVIAINLSSHRGAKCARRPPPH